MMHKIAKARFGIQSCSTIDQLLANSCQFAKGSEATGVFVAEVLWQRALSDPRNRNHKSLAISNHNFKVASFSRRNRSKIAVSQSQKSHWAKKIAAIQNHTLVVATYSGGFPDPCGSSETL